MYLLCFFLAKKFFGCKRQLKEEERIFESQMIKHEKVVVVADFSSFGALAKSLAAACID